METVVMDRDGNRVNPDPNLIKEQAHRVVQDPRREVTAVEDHTLKTSIKILEGVIAYMEQGGVHASMLEGTISTYEKMLDAMMYGYPAAVFDGWAEGARPTHCTCATQDDDTMAMHKITCALVIAALRPHPSTKTAAGPLPSASPMHLDHPNDGARYVGCPGCHPNG